MTIGEKVRYLRKERNLTLQALSDKIGISKEHLSCIELDKMEPKLYTLSRIAKGLQVPLWIVFVDVTIPEQATSDRKQRAWAK